MSPASLHVRLDLPRKIRLSSRVWAAAAVLGLLRTTVNDEHRGATRDRGAEKNILNDLQGSLGELVGLAVVCRARLSEGARGLLDLEGSVDRPDLVADTDPPTLLDVKCHFDEPDKRLFLVNEIARRRSVDRGVVAFMPIVTAARRSYAYVGALIPVEQLETWDLEDLGGYGDPARLLSLAELDQQYLGANRIRWRTTQPDRVWGPSVLSYESFMRLQQVVGPSMLSRLRKDGFSLDGLKYEEVREKLLGLIPSQLRIELEKT